MDRPDAPRCGSGTATRNSSPGRSPPHATACRTRASSAIGSRWAAPSGASWSIGFAAQLGELRLGFTQLAALYVLVDTGTTTIADLADALGRSQSATSRLVDGLVKRGFAERRAETDDRRQRTVWLTPSGQALLAQSTARAPTSSWRWCGPCRRPSAR